MKRNDFRVLNALGKINRPKQVESNPIMSDTDPTLDCPLSKVYESAMTGKPINIVERKVTFNNLHGDQLSSIDKRNNDAFDAFRELRAEKKSLNAKLGIIDKKNNELLKQKKQNENEEN